MSIEKSYNHWADQYDTNQNKTRDLDRVATVQTLSSYQFKTVIELGCGTGKNTEYLLDRAEKIIGLDFSQEMLNKAKEKFDDQRINFQKADLTKAWQIQDQFADLITCSLVLEHIEDLDFIFKEASRTLEKGGLFFISELHPCKQYTGSKARYQSDQGIQELETFIHHISEFLNAADTNGFKLIALNEWFDGLLKNEIPRLISFVFRK